MMTRNFYVHCVAGDTDRKLKKPTPQGRIPNEFPPGNTPAGHNENLTQLQSRRNSGALCRITDDGLKRYFVKSFPGRPSIASDIRNDAIRGI